MKRLKRFAPMGVVLVVLGLLVGATSGAASGAATKSSKGPDPALVAKLENSARGSVTIKTKKSTGAASFVKAGQNGDLLPASTGSAQAKAQEFLAEYGALLGVTDAGQQLIPTSIVKDANGGEHVSYRQVQNGVPVFGAELKAHTDKAGNLTAVNGTIVPDANINTTPKLSAEQAAGRAIAIVQASPPTNEVTGRDADTSGLTAAANLVVYRQGLIRGADGASQLAYKVEVSNGAGINEVVFVHAHVGKVLNRYSTSASALHRELYEQSPFNPPVWIEGQAFPGSLNADQQNLVTFSGHTYHLFNNAFGRDSYDGAGATMKTVNNDPTINCPNANWNGITTNYCTGVTGDDTVAHEWGHAYTEFTHGLIYQWQPGALNESYSDIWGEVVDLVNGVGTDSPSPTRGANSCSSFIRLPAILVINSPASIAGNCEAQVASFGPLLSAAGTMGNVVLADDGVAVNTNACEPLTAANAAAMAGKIALVDRGVCNFTVKVKNAQNAGAIAVVVANNAATGLPGMGGGDPTITIPSVGISQANGNLIKANLAAGVTVTMKPDPSANAEDSYKWLSGEDDPAFGGAIRDMWDPTCLSDPGKVSDAEYACDPGDQGGVHTNSGVPNHGFALLVDGGAYNGHTVASIGLTKAAHLYWRAQSVYQTPTTDFVDHADALEASCADLIGDPLNALGTTSTPTGVSPDVFSSADCIAVSEMIAAVQLRTDPTQCGFTTLLDPNAPDLCAKAKKVKAHETDFKGKDMKDWSLSNVGVFSGWQGTNWVQVKKDQLPGGRKHEGAYASDVVEGNCDGGAGDVSGVMSMTSKLIRLPKQDFKSPRLTFEHYVATEFGFDGGNVKISVNGGAWTLIPASAFLFNPYNTTLVTAAGGNTNPLQGQPGFSGTDGGSVFGTWGQSQIDLTKVGVAAGDTIQLRFDFGTDGCGGVDGWYIQNVLVMACDTRKEPAPAPPVTAKQD